MGEWCGLHHTQHIPVSVNGEIGGCCQPLWKTPWGLLKTGMWDLEALARCPHHSCHFPVLGVRLLTQSLRQPLLLSPAVMCWVQFFVSHTQELGNQFPDYITHSNTVSGWLILACICVQLSGQLGENCHKLVGHQMLSVQSVSSSRRIALQGIQRPSGLTLIYFSNHISLEAKVA